MSFPPVPAAAKLPVPIGTPAVGEIPQVSQVSPLELEWAGSSGSGTVTSVTAADPSIVVTGTDTVDPEIATATLDVIAAEHPPAENWSNNGKKITSQANGTASTDSAAYGQTLAGGNLAPLTTEGDLLIANATPAPARLAVGTPGQSLGVAAGVPAWLVALQLQATTNATGLTGYALVNGTGNIITWTTPNDGNMHRAFIVSTIHVSSTQTGGQIHLAFTSPDGSAGAVTINAGGGGSGSVSSAIETVLIAPNTTVTISQSSAQTGGAATLFAEIWGS